jgi:hypothetical protein
MSYQTGTATGYDDLLNKLDTFLTSQGMCLSPAYTGTGNGTISGLIGGSASIAETITVTMTSSTAFSVSGSVSGALGTGTVGTAFTSTKVNFTITAGGIAFVVGDMWTFGVTSPWTSLRRNAGLEMIWQAPGNGGTDQIFVGAQVFSNVAADYYNWRLGGFTAFNSALTFQQQAGYVGGNNQANPSPVLNLWNQSTPYWFIANGRRVIVIAKVSTVYVMAFLGFISPYMSPGAFPYPLFVGGSMAWNSEPASTSVNWRWSYVGQQIVNFPWGFGASGSASTPVACTARLRLPSGTWVGFDQYENENTVTLGATFPFCASMTDWRLNLDGGYSMLPCVLWDNTPNVYGELDGVLGITGFQQGSENTITIGNSTYLVVQDISRTTKVDYCAVKLI